MDSAVPVSSRAAALQFNLCLVEDGGLDDGLVVAFHIVLRNPMGVAVKGVGVSGRVFTFRCCSRISHSLIFFIFSLIFCFRSGVKISLMVGVRFSRRSGDHLTPSLPKSYSRSIVCPSAIVTACLRKLPPHFSQWNLDVKQCLAILIGGVGSPVSGGLLSCLIGPGFFPAIARPVMLQRGAIGEFGDENSLLWNGDLLYLLS